MFFIKNENIKGVKQNRAMIIKNTIKEKTRNKN